MMIQTSFSHSLRPILRIWMDVELSGGCHPDAGQYIIDPDYFDILGMEDPSELFKFHK